jgi:hypothetical protein
MAIPEAKLFGKWSFDDVEVRSRTDCPVWATGNAYEMMLACAVGFIMRSIIVAMCYGRSSSQLLLDQKLLGAAINTGDRLLSHRVFCFLFFVTLLNFFSPVEYVIINFAHRDKKCRS